MKNQPVPYYTLPVCCHYERPNGEFNPNVNPLMNEGVNQGSNQLAPITPTNQPQPLTLTSVEYLNGFLRTQIGKKVRVEFLIGTGTLLDKFGTLVGVGANYIMLQQAETDDVIVCDFYSIKFITFYF